MWGAMGQPYNVALLVRNLGKAEQPVARDGEFDIPEEEITLHRERAKQPAAWVPSPFLIPKAREEYERRQSAKA